MQQGKASSSHMGSTKTEPVSKAVSPGGVAQIGASQYTKPIPIYEGRGLKAPMVSETCHCSGSQGTRK